MENWPEEDKEQAFLLIKAIVPLPEDIKEVREEINGNTTILYVTTNDPNKRGEITMVLEEDGWKLEEEYWGTAR